jgi:hypothetical protein
VTVKLDLTGMADGQQAGIAHYSAHWSTFGVIQNSQVRTIVFHLDGKPVVGPNVTGNTLWLRSEWDFAGRSQYSYSSDGKTFVEFGPVYPLTWGDYRGDRIAVFTFNDVSDQGYVDVDSFHYTVERPNQQLPIGS